MNRMGIPQPDYTPDGVLAEIARGVPFLKGASATCEEDRISHDSKFAPLACGTRPRLQAARA